MPGALVAVCRGDPPGRATRWTCSGRSVSVMARFDPEVEAPPTSHAANVRKAERMLAQMPTAVAARERISKGLEPSWPRGDLDFSANFLYMVHGEAPSEGDAQGVRPLAGPLRRARAERLDLLGRVTVSTLSDIYSGIVAAIGTLKGPLHGGADEEAWKVLEQRQIARQGREMDPRTPWPARSGSWGLATGSTRPATPRHRSPLKATAPAWPPEVGDDRWERIAEPIEKAVTGQEAGLPQRGLARRPPLPLHGPRDPLSTRRSSPWPGSPDGQRGLHHRTARPQPPDEAPGPLHRPAQPGHHADRRSEVTGPTS